MTGHVVSRPPAEHHCRPGCTYTLITKEIADKAAADPYIPILLPVGMRQVHLPDASNYPRGTVWQCDECGQRWVSLGRVYSNAPGHVEFRRQWPPREPGRLSRWWARRKEKRG